MDFLENINHHFGSTKYWISKANAHLNDGTGNFTKRANAYDISHPNDIYTGWAIGISSTLIDVDGDSYPDMLASEQSSGGTVSSKVYLLKGKGDGSFHSPALVFTTNSHPATYMTLGDFNNDGKADAIVGQDDDGDPGSAFLFLGQGDGTFQQTSSEAFDVRPDIESGNDQPGGGKFQSYDVNGDGMLDIITAHKNTGPDHPNQSSTLQFMQGNGDGGFGVLQTIESVIIVNTAFHAPMIRVDELAIHGDLNGDRCVDRNADLMMLINHLRFVRDPLLRDVSFDLNHDGVVNLADARKLVTLFTKPRGVACAALP